MPTVTAAATLPARIYRPLTSPWALLFPRSSGLPVYSRKGRMSLACVKGRHSMTLASGGAAGASSPLPARPAPERQIGFLPFTPPGTHEGRPAYSADRACYCQPLASVRRGMEREGHGAGEDLLVDDEGHRGDVEHGERREGEVHRPLPALRTLLDDPAPYRRQPENDQGDADRECLVEALVEDGHAIPISRAEGREPVEQQQVHDGEEPDDVGHPLQLLPVLAELPLRRGVGRSQHRQGQGDDEEPGQQEGVPGQPAEHAAGEGGGDGRGGGVGEADDREPDAVPPPQGSDPLRPGQRDDRRNRQGGIEAEYAAGPQHVGFRVGECQVGVQIYPAGDHEDDRDEHGQAQEKQRERAFLDGDGRELVVLAGPSIYYRYVTPTHL